MGLRAVLSYVRVAYTGLDEAMSRNGTHALHVALLALLIAVLPARAVTLDEARTLHGRGELDAALAAYAELTADPTTHSAADRGTAYNNACVILLNKGDYTQARERCESALTLRRAQQDNLRGLARTLNNSGLVHQQLGDFDRAGESYREALRINRERDDPLAVAINCSNLGLLRTLAGNYGLAASYFDQAIAVADANADAPWADQQRALARINQGVALEKLGAYREALELFQRVRSTPDLLDDRQRALLEVNVGVVYRNLGDPVAALQAFDDAKPLYEALGDRSGLANAWLNSGRVKHLDLAEGTAAEPDLQRALDIARTSGDRTEEIASLLALGRLALDQREQLARAEEHFDLAHVLAESTGSAEAAWSSLEGLARVALARGDLDQALDQLQRAMAIVASVSTSVRSTQLRSDFFGERRAVYELAVSILAAQHSLRPDAQLAREALRVARQAKARELNEALGRPAPAEYADAPDARHVLIEYFLAEDKLYRWVMAGTSQEQFLALEGDVRELERAVNRLYRQLAAGEQADAMTVAQVSDQLLREMPLSLQQQRALDIAPDAFLYRVPFDLLRTDDGAPLVDQLSVAMLPSTSLLTVAPSPVRPVSAWAGFANPTTDGLGSLSPLASQRLPVALDALPAASDELDRATRWIKGDTARYRGDEATEQSVLKALSGGVAIVHLATHAILDERVGGTAAVVLTPTTEDDGLLRPDEIASLPIRTDLAVLSACRTAADLASEPRALESLTGAFLAGGANAVVATLWDVEDTVSAAFMDQFYYQLSRGESAGDALRLAKLTLRGTAGWSHPTHWAAYVLVGQADLYPLGRRSPATLMFTLVISAAAFAALWLLLALRRRAGASE